MIMPSLFPEYAYPSLGVEEFESLDFQVEKMDEMLKPILQELETKRKRRDQLALVFNPHIVVSEVNTPTMGHSYIGKIRIPANTLYNTMDKPKFLNFSLGKVINYNGKDDPKLANLAKKKARDVVFRKIFNFLG
ncbi:MAG: hypothetical protein RL059_64 [Bacteroidota bacterium]|jgi:hypothetical protein